LNNSHTIDTWLSDDLKINISSQHENSVRLFFTSITNNYADVILFNNIQNTALKERILENAPCLYQLLPFKPKAKVLVHFAELTLGTRITQNNVQDAFTLSHPDNITFRFRAIVPPDYRNVTGDYCEALCSEVLSNSGVPHMNLDINGWPIWESKAHLSLNAGKFHKIKSYGDILIPSGPTNILISIKSVAARERLLMSGNRFESIGFGFFNEPEEFWAENKINLLKRMGFTAIYMPSTTLDAINQKLLQRNISRLATNINGKDLFRSLQTFGTDIELIAGKLTIDL
jgi:hypothetical protein